MHQKNEVKVLLESIIEGIKEKKGEEIVQINLLKLEHSVSDYFIICHAQSGRQVDAIADNVERRLRKNFNEHVIHKEGASQAEWVLLDFSNIVVHVFQKDVRNQYQLEELWGDGEFTRFNDQNE